MQKAQAVCAVSSRTSTIEFAARAGVGEPNPLDSFRSALVLERRSLSEQPQIPGGSGAGLPQERKTIGR